MAKHTRLFFVRCNPDGSWLTQRKTEGGGHIFEHAPADPMLVSGPMGEWGGAYELIPSPFTVETWPEFPIQPKNEEQIIRVFIEDGLIQEVTGHGARQTVRIIDLDVEGSDAEDRQELSMDDRPAYKVDDDERSNGPKPIEAFVANWRIA